MNNKDLKVLHDKNVDYQRLAEAHDLLAKASDLLRDSFCSIEFYEEVREVEYELLSLLSSEQHEAEKLLHPTG